MSDTVYSGSCVAAQCERSGIVRATRFLMTESNILRVQLQHLLLNSTPEEVRGLARVVGLTALRLPHLRKMGSALLDQVDEFEQDAREEEARAAELERAYNTDVSYFADVEKGY